MQSEELKIQKKYRKKAARFKGNKKTGWSDLKRHDRISNTEAKDMLKAYEEGLSVPKIAEIFDRDIRAVKSAIKRVSPVEELPVVRTEPTWFPRFATRLRNVLHFPDPAVFFETMSVRGQHYMYDEYGEKVGPFYWDARPGGEVTVRFYDPDTDFFLENDQYFRLLLDIRPGAKPLLDDYKKHGEDYVVAANALLSAIIDAGKRSRSTSLSDVADQESMRSFRREAPSSRRLYLILGHQENRLLTLHRAFFTTAYATTVRRVGHEIGRYPKLPSGDYTIGVKGEGVVLSFDHHQLAEGSEADLQTIEEIHRSLIHRYAREDSKLAKDILKSAEKAFDTRNKLLLQL